MPLTAYPSAQSLLVRMSSYLGRAVSVTYRKNLKNSDTRKNCCNYVYPKFEQSGLTIYRVMSPTAADQMDLELVLHCLPRPVYLKTWIITVMFSFTCNFQVLTSLVNEPDLDPYKIIESNNWWQLNDEEELRRLCIAELEKDPTTVEYTIQYPEKLGLLKKC